MANADNVAPEGGHSVAKPGLFENKLVLVLAILAVQGGMAFAVGHFVLRPHTAPPVALTTENGAPRERGILVSLDEMVISLNTSGGRARYLRTTIALEAADAEVVAEVEERMPEFRDAAIMTLSSHTPEDLGSVEGKEAVKAQIKSTVTDLIQTGELLNIYFSDFVVQ